MNDLVEATMFVYLLKHNRDFLPLNVTNINTTVIIDYSHWKRQIFDWKGIFHIYNMKNNQSF